MVRGTMWLTPSPLGMPRYVQDYEPGDAKTPKGLDLNRMTMAELYKYYDLSQVGVGGCWPGGLKWVCLVLAWTSTA